MAEKSPDAFRTISEVAEEVRVPAHVLRFWESRFSQIRPVKRAGGRRYYRPEDVELIAGIKRLLHDHGMTIRGVQKLLKDHGAAHVATLGTARPDLPDGRPLSGIAPFAPPPALAAEPGVRTPSPAAEARHPAPPAFAAPAFEGPADLPRSNGAAKPGRFVATQARTVPTGGPGPADAAPPGLLHPVPAGDVPPAPVAKADPEAESAPVRPAATAAPSVRTIPAPDAVAPATRTIPATDTAVPAASPTASGTTQSGTARPAAAAKAPASPAPADPIPPAPAGTAPPAGRVRLSLSGAEGGAGTEGAARLMLGLQAGRKVPAGTVDRLRPLVARLVALRDRLAAQALV